MYRKPLLSVIVPVFKTELWLRPCLDSLVDQEGDYPYQVILVDDGSPDGSGAICDDYAQQYPEIFTAIHQKNGGLPVARNSGIECCDGDWISFVDSDDIPRHDYVKILLDSALSFPDADCACAGFSYLDGKGREKKPLVASYEGTLDSWWALKLLLGDFRCRAFVWDKIFRKELLEKNGISFYGFKAGFEDLPFVFSAFCHSRLIVFTNRICYSYRSARPGSLTQGALGRKRLEQHLASYFACRAAADRVLGTGRAVRLFKKKLLRIRMSLSADLGNSRWGGFFPSLKAMLSTTSLLKSQRIPAKGSFFERQVSAYASEEQVFGSVGETEIESILKEVQR